jgi:DNA repair photolyase
MSRGEATDKNIRGRGAADNPTNRFEKIERLPEPEAAGLDEDSPDPKTAYFRERARTILTKNDSPDLPFTWSLNPYRGCEHGCSYCYARPTHEYLGLSAGLDFETKIIVKENAPELLREALSAQKWKPDTITMSGVTDCYQPVERRLRLTRRCLEVLAEFRNPVAIITKNHLITRDANLLAELAREKAAVAFISITTLDRELARVMEPRTAAPERRLAAIAELAKAGVPVGVMAAPVVPGLTDHELPAILSAAAKAGATLAGWVPLRLPYAVAPLFADWLERRFPDRMKKVLNQIASMRGGRLNDPNFGSRMRGEGPLADEIGRLFELARRKAGLSERRLELSTAAFRRPGQLDLL